MPTRRAAILNLDLCVTVDTSVAHLAGALARPIWVLIPFAPDCRWLLDREDTPWYPSMRLFRQQQPGDWAPVLDRVRAELAKFAVGDQSVLLPRRADQNHRTATAIADRLVENSEGLKPGRGPNRKKGPMRSC